MDTEKIPEVFDNCEDISALRQNCFYYYNKASHQDLEKIGFLWTDIDEKSKGEHIDTILQNKKEE